MIKTTNRNSMLMILVDALPFNQLSRSNTPFLYSLSKNCSIDIEPLFAYRGIESTIFTGNNPNKHKIWTEYCLNEDKLIKGTKSSLFLKSIIKITDKIPNDFLSGASRYFLYKLFKNEFSPAMIPVELLDYFEMSQKPIITPYSLQLPTLFDLIRNNNMSFKFLAPPFENNDKIIFENTMEAIGEDKDFWFIKFGMFDYLGHIFGPDSEEAKNQLRLIDNYIKEIYFRFEEEYPDFTFILLSDHSMAKVTKEINILEKLEKIEFKVPKDYLFFVDSTMVRFWFFNPKAEEKILEMLSNLEVGHILMDDDYKKLNIENIGTKYGEKIFVLDEGFVFFPDFFRKNSKPKGMHGYASESSRPTLIIESPNVKLEKRKDVKFVDILPTILDIWGLPKPNLCDGISLMKK